MLMLSSAQGFIDFLIKQNLASSILQLKTLRLLCIQLKPKLYIFAWTKKWPGRIKSYFEKLDLDFRFISLQFRLSQPWQHKTGRVSSTILQL